MELTRRNILKLGSLALLGGTGLAANKLYNAMPPSLSHARQYDQGEYRFADPPIRLQSSYKGKIKRSFVIGHDRCKSEVRQLVHALADNFGDVVVLDGGYEEPYKDVIMDSSSQQTLYQGYVPCLY